MAWRPRQNLIEGELDNRTPGRVTGWLSFVGLPERVTLSLDGDFHRDIRGTVIRLSNPKPADRGTGYMEGFCLIQTGNAGDITAGLPPQDYVDYPYIEWYSDNGRVVLELEPTQLTVIGDPMPWQKEPPVSREEQGKNFGQFLTSLGSGIEAATKDETTEG